eukprot:1269123-Pleurochrysis_carterae.AAC.1
MIDAIHAVTRGEAASPPWSFAKACITPAVTAAVINMTFVMRDTRGQRSLTLRTPVTTVGRRCSSWSLTLDSVATSGRGSTFVDSAGSTI